MANDRANNKHEDKSANYLDVYQLSIKITGKIKIAIKKYTLKPG